MKSSSPSRPKRGGCRQDCLPHGDLAETGGGVVAADDIRGAIGQVVRERHIDLVDAEESSGVGNEWDIERLEGSRAAGEIRQRAGGWRGRARFAGSESLI